MVSCCGEIVMPCFYCEECPELTVFATEECCGKCLCYEHFDEHSSTHEQRYNDMLQDSETYRQHMRDAGRGGLLK